MSAELVVMRETNLLDIAATLRNSADSVEAGEYGAASSAVVVLDAHSLEVFYMGTGEAGPNAHLLLASGQTKMLNQVLAGKL